MNFDIIGKLMDKALQFESRFSLPPNSLGYCGKKTAGYKFKQCIINGNCKGIKTEISKFIVLNPYLELLKKITNEPKFSHKLIESYWIGNSLLKTAKPKDFLILLKLFEKQGVPDFFVEELKENLPEKFIPSHLFQVLHVGVGKASGSVPFNIKTINNCMIRWGKVTKITENIATIELNSLEQNGKHKYKITILKEKVPFDKDMIKNLKNSDIVAVHWNMVIKKLTNDEIKKIDYWTNEVLKLNF